MILPPRGRPGDLNFDATSATLPSRSGRGGSPAPARILVTEDRPEVLRSVARALGESYVCDFATDIEEVRAKLSTGDFALALCGVAMEGASGLGLVKEIGRTHPDTAVVLITSEDDPEVAGHALNFGVYGYLVEPFWPGQLLIAVMNALRRRELELAGQTHSRVLAQQAIDDLWASHRETVDRFATAIELNDSSTGEHVNRMASIAALLGEWLGLGPEQVQLLRIAAPMHDLGKIGIPDSILKKPGPLTTEERTEMQRHTTIGHEILSGSESALLRVAATITLTHHECFDGSGYPRGLVGEAIPIEGRIAALADVFDALLSDRCYRPAFPPEEAVEMIAAGRGTQFDPAIVDCLLDNLDDALFARA
jgi:putative two-component system response regulator